MKEQPEYPKGTEIRDEQGNLVATLARSIKRYDIIDRLDLLMADGYPPEIGEEIHPAIKDFFRKTAPPLR